MTNKKDEISIVLYFWNYEIQLQKYIIYISKKNDKQERRNFDRVILLKLWNSITKIVYISKKNDEQEGRNFDRVILLKLWNSITKIV